MWIGWVDTCGPWASSIEHRAQRPLSTSTENSRHPSIEDEQKQASIGDRNTTCCIILDFGFGVQHLCNRNKGGTMQFQERRSGRNSDLLHAANILQGSQK